MKNKLPIILNENTIVDIGFLYQLIKRYKSHFIVSALVFASMFLFNYLKQPIVSSVTVPLKVVIAQKVSNDLTSLMPVENVFALSLEEINITLSSQTFLSSVANKLLSTREFDSLNFGEIKSTKSLFGRDIKAKCQNNKDCIELALKASLPGLYFIERGLTEDRFTLTINSIDKTTSISLAKIISKAAEEERIKNRQYFIKKEIQNVNTLISESQALIKSVGGYTALEEQEKLQNNTNELKEKIKMLQYNASLEMVVYSSLQAKMTENKKNAVKKQDGVEELQKIQARLNDIKLNLSSLNNIPVASRTASDKLIISQLLLERSNLMKTIPSDVKISSMKHREIFQNKQSENSEGYEFDFLVSKNKLAKLSADSEIAKVELNKLVQEKLANEIKVNGMKSDLDFLKNLESKLSSLKLLSATINSDLIFEDNNAQAFEFRRTSVIKMAAFCLSLTAFLYLFSLFIRFYLDDKIYGEEEIRLQFDKLDFIGEVPSFE